MALKLSCQIAHGAVLTRPSKGKPLHNLGRSSLIKVHLKDLTSAVKIYADNTKILCTISSPVVDIPALQCDLDRLGIWANKWQMHFIADKCDLQR